MATAETNKPVHEIRIGRIKTSVWKTEGEYGPKLQAKAPVLSYRVPVEKRKGKSDDGWRESAYFSREETLVAQKVLERAFDYIAEYKEDAQ